MWPNDSNRYVSTEEQAMQDAEALREAGDELVAKAIEAQRTLQGFLLHVDRKTHHLSVSVNDEVIHRQWVELDDAIARWKSASS